MFEMFSSKLANTTPQESRLALLLLTMAVPGGSNIITDNLNLFVEVGLGEQAQSDLSLACDTCRALLTIVDEHRSENNYESTIK